MTSVQRIEALTRQAAERAQRLRALRERGSSYRDTLREEERPLLVELMTQMTEALSDAGAQFRRALARALYEEGATMDQIGDLFGVSRQRVSTLLARTREQREADQPE